MKSKVFRGVTPRCFVDCSDVSEEAAPFFFQLEIKSWRKSIPPKRQRLCTGSEILKFLIDFTVF
jgi:hypothetical protein